MAKKRTNYRDPKWFAKEFKDMTEIAHEPPQAGFYSDIRVELPRRCDRPLNEGKMQAVYGLICSSLVTLAGELMTAGAIGVVGGDTRSWEVLRRGFLYDAWAARFRHAFIAFDRSYDQPRNPATAALFIGKEALTLCHAIATADDDFAHAFGAHLLATFEKTAGGDKLYFYNEPFFPFVLKLYSVWVGQEIEFRADVSDPLRRYRQVFDHWHSPSDLGNALLDLCDLHCEEAVDNGGAAAYAFHPYNVFPVEIMAVLRIRRLLGLETPEISHQLLQTPLVTPPPPPVVDDDLLNRAIHRFRTDFPDGRDFR